MATRTMRTVTPPPSTLLDFTIFAYNTSQSDPARNAIHVMNANHIPDADDTASATGRGGSFIAPASGGTSERTAGRNLLTNNAGKPYLSYSFLKRSSAFFPTQPSSRCMKRPEPYRLPM